MWMCGAVDVTNVLGENVDYNFGKDLFHHEDVNRRFF